MVARIFTYELVPTTPMIITSATGFRGMCYTVATSYVPGSMVRGALMTRLLEEKLIDQKDVENEALNPLHSVSPALYAPQPSKPVPYRDLAFAHALSFVFKGEDKVFSLGIEQLMLLIERGKDVETALRELLLDTMFRVDRRAYSNIASDPSWIFKCSAEMKSAAHEPLARIDGVWKIVKPSRGVYVENAVDRARESAMHGALYAYEYVEPGSRFVGFIAVDESSALATALDSLKGSCTIVRIGRGLGRGFGIARLCISEARPEDFELQIEVPKNSRIALYAFSPLTKADEPYRPPCAGDELTLRVFGSRVCRARVVASLGRGLLRYGGWSYRSGTPKMPIKALQPGSLIFIEILETYDRDLFTYLPFAGISELSSQGFDIAAPLHRDFLPSHAS